MTASTIARLKITLDDVKPIVQRRVEVPLTMRLDRLHLVLQAALGWTNSHLYEIRAGDVGWGMVDPDWGDGPLDAAKARLLDLIEDTGAKTFKYLYDFGDGWEHTVRIERVIDAVPGLPYPILIDGTGACPPEDVGGPWGYSDFIDALADPNHERHAELKEWIGDTFDPLAFNIDERAKAVDALARKWSRKPKAVRR
jgi:hypothetical protein